MKNFKQFIKEELRTISVDTTYSNVYSGSKYDILKKPNYDGEYIDWEIEAHEMMKKRPDLFCKIIKSSKTQVLVEKLDTKLFIQKIQKEYDLFNKLEKIKEEYDLKLSKTEPNFNNIMKFYKTKGLGNVIDILNYDKNYIIKVISNKLLQQYFLLMWDICEYFQKFLIKYSDCRIDLPIGNFGFIKGTQEIRCFDPIG